eukprot:4277395-Ditylum_brightwellii.AAC.1
MEVWQPSAQLNKLTNNMKAREDINLRNVDMSDEKTKVVHSEEFPFLDMAMTWKDNCLRFGVYCIPKQVLKYVDTSSTHRSTVFKPITSGFFTRLTRLTSNYNKVKNKSFEEVYPEHAKVLKKLALHQV